MADDELRTVLGQIFDLLDADKSGHIEEAEGLAIAHHMGSSDKVAFWESMIRDMDTDGDGKISKLEYIDFNVSSGMKLKGAQMLKTELMDKGFNGSGIPPATMDSVERVLMSKLLPAIEAAHAAGKTPILVDATDPKKAQDFSPLETFLSYSGHEVFEAKKMVVEVNMKKEKSLEDAREEQRVKLCRAMKHGTYFIIAMSTGAPPWKKKFCDDESLPLALFEGIERKKTGNAEPIFNPDHDGVKRRWKVHCCSFKPRLYCKAGPLQQTPTMEPDEYGPRRRRYHRKCGGM